jgi:hypothetical protein
MVWQQRRGKTRHILDAVVSSFPISTVENNNSVGTPLQGPHLRTPNLGFNPGFTPCICYIKGWGEPRVKPGVWRPEIWAQEGGK